MDSVISSNSSSIDLNWQIYARAQEREKNNENSYTSIYYKYNKEDVEEFKISPKETSEKSQNVRNKTKWIAYKQQFFSTVLIAGNSFENATLVCKNITDSSQYLKVFKSEIGIPYQNAASQQIDMAFYFGPNHYQTLKKYNLDLEELVTLGSWIVKWINRFLIIPVFNS